MRLWNLHCKCMQHVMTLCVSANYVNSYCGAMQDEGYFLQILFLIIVTIHSSITLLKGQALPV